MGKNQSQDFDAQVASTTLTMIQYNLLALAKRFAGYESLGELFRNTKAETIELTVAEKKNTYPNPFQIDQNFQ